MQQFTTEQDYTKKLDISLWKRLVVYARPYYKNLGLVALFMTLTALIDAAYPLLNSYAIDKMIQNNDLSAMKVFAPIYFGISILSGVLVYLFLCQSAKIEVGTCYIIRQAGFKRLQELSFTFYDRTPVGYLMSRMTSDIQRLADTIGWTLIDLVWGSVIIVIYCVIMFLKDWRLALLVIAVTPALAVLSVYFQKHILAAYRAVRKTNSQITGAFNEGIMGAKTTKTLVREERNFDEFKQLTATMRTSSVRAAMLSAVYLPIVTTIGTFAMGLALWKGAMTCIRA
jgi:ATP-binding cassette subfamily B protein